MLPSINIQSRFPRENVPAVIAFPANMHLTSAQYSFSCQSNPDWLIQIFQGHQLYAKPYFVMNFVMATPRVGEEKKTYRRICSRRLAVLMYHAWKFDFVRFEYMYGLLTKCEVEMAGYWPSSFFACLWTETNTARDLVHLARSRS